VLLENLPCLAQSYIGILPKAAGLELTHGGTATPRERSSDPDPTPEDVELATNDESRLGSHDGMFWYTTTRGVALKIRVNLDPGWADGTTMIRSPNDHTRSVTISKCGCQQVVPLIILNSNINTPLLVIDPARRKVQITF
jgi:hypothetical protein